MSKLVMLIILLSFFITPAEAAKYQITELEATADADSSAHAINNNGDVAGAVNYSAAVWKYGKLIDIGKLGRESSYANDINDKGQVVGSTYSVFIPDKAPCAFIWENGSAKELGYADRPPADAYGINNIGQVVGSSSDRAFLWDAQNGMKSIGAFKYGPSVAHAINHKGQVVGESDSLACIWQDNKMAALHPLDEMEGSRALDINDKGQVVGESYDGTSYGKKQASRACLWEDGKITDLGNLGGTLSYAFAMNNKGQIVGKSSVSEGITNRDALQAFLWENGKMVNLNTLIPADSGWILYSAGDINEKGQIVGTGRYKDNKRAFLLTPCSDDPKCKKP